MEPTMEAGVAAAGGTRVLMGPVLQIDEGRIREHLDEVVRSTVEDILNALLDAEADHLCGTVLPGNATNQCPFAHFIFPHQLAADACDN
jgi:hypothetical protein